MMMMQMKYIHLSGQPSAAVYLTLYYPVGITSAIILGTVMFGTLLTRTLMGWIVNVWYSQLAGGNPALSKLY